ncbi:hypothetical protein SLA2020_420450 [Shorea laevis]
MEPTRPEAGWSIHEDPSLLPWLAHDAHSPSQTDESVIPSFQYTSNQRNSGSKIASDSISKNDVDLFPPNTKQLVWTTAAGYWKSTGEDCSIRSSRSSCDGLIGMKRPWSSTRAALPMARAPSGSCTSIVPPRGTLLGPALTRYDFSFCSHIGAFAFCSYLVL